MLFILTNSQDATTTFLVASLQKTALPFVRLDTDSVLESASFEYTTGEPRLRIGSNWHTPDEVSHIWYRRPEQLVHSRFDDTPEGKYARAEWTEFIENFFAHVPKRKWMNHPSSNAAASRKLEQLATASSLNLQIPDTLATQAPDSLRAFYAKHKGRVVTKPISTGYVERPQEESDSLIYTNLLRDKDLVNLDDLCVCPTLFQQFIEKAYDVRITVVDSQITAVALFAKDADGTSRCDIRRNNMSDVVYSKIDLPDSVKDGILRLMASYGLRFAAIDMAVSVLGEWYFLEVNPNGQWAWLDTSAETNIADSFVNAFSKSPGE